MLRAALYNIILYTRWSNILLLARLFVSLLGALEAARVLSESCVDHLVLPGDAAGPALLAFVGSLGDDDGRLLRCLLLELGAVKLADLLHLLRLRQVFLLGDRLRLRLDLFELLDRLNAREG